MDLVLLLALLALSALFSGSETALFSLGDSELARLRSEHGKRGRAVDEILSRANDVLSALLFGNLLVNTATGVVATSLCVEWLGPRGVAVAVPGATLALLLLGEITPKMLALRARFRLALLLQTPLRIWLRATWPLLRLIGILIDWILARLPFDRSGSRSLTNEELQVACDLAVQEGTLTESEGLSLARMLGLEDIEVVQIMTPRTEVVSLQQDMSLRQLLGAARRAGFNRYPVLDPESGRPSGLFHLKDLLLLDPVPEFPLRDKLRPLLFVPESKNVAALLAEMGEGAGHLAAVVDEHGDFTGIVTMADCLQALMGPVADWAVHDPELVPLGDGRWVIAGRTDLRELRETCGLELESSRNYVTVAGYLMARLGRIPEPGDRITLENARLTVLEMTGHRVDRIGLTLRAARDESDGRRSEP